MATNVLADLSDADLVSHVRRLLTSGAKLEVETLLALNVIHERKLYRPAGCGSFHVYCVNVLRMSDDTAGRRSKVGKLLRLYPALVRELIETEAASVTALWKLEPVITDENAERLLNEVRGKTVREVELMVVREAPRPAVQSGFRTVFAPSLTLNAEHATTSVDSNAARHADASVVPSEVKLRIDAASAMANMSPPRSKKKPIEPRAVDHYAFSANMNEATKTKLREAMDVGNFENYDALFAAAVDALRAEVLKRKYALVKRPWQKAGAAQAYAKAAQANSGANPSVTGASEANASGTKASQTRTSEINDARTSAAETTASGLNGAGTRALETNASGLGISGSSDAEANDFKTRDEASEGEALSPVAADPRAISASVRRAVFIRDGGRCTFQGTDGRCTETKYIELHHRVAVASGGQPTAGNMTLHCRAHNVYQAELDFGAEHMGQFVKAVGEPGADL